jgi:uncharacterized protein YcfJ
MKFLMAKFVGSVVAVLMASTGAQAQSYYDDQACRQYADAQTAPLRDQVNSQALGGTLLGAGLGAALGAAVGGGRGAGIGAASGAIVGTGSAPPMPRMRRDTCNSNTARIIRSAWHPEDIHHRHLMARRYRPMVQSKVI